MGWYNSAWTRRKKITIDPAQIDAELTNYSLIVPLDTIGIDTADVVTTASDGTTVLPHTVSTAEHLGTGGWSWFSNPRAIYVSGKTFIGSIATDDLYVGQYTHSTGALLWTQLTANLEYDDHDNPALISRSDGRLVAFYAKHGVDTSLRYKISTNALDATGWGAEQVVTLGSSVTYANPIILPSDSNACYVFSRMWEGAGDSNWSYIRSTDYSSWGSSVEIWDCGVKQQYLHCRRNGDGRIDFFASDGHPDTNGNTSLFHFYAAWDNGSSALKWYNSAGVEKTLPMDHTKATLVYDGSDGTDAWNHDIAIDAGGLPRVLFQKRVSATDLRCMFARWDGSVWTTPVEIAAFGGYLYAAEPSYTGCSCFDGNNLNIVYLGKQVSGLYEMQEWGSTDNGVTWTKYRDITKNSPSLTRNIRPVSPEGHPEKMACIWSSGSYATYTNYNLRIYADPPISAKCYLNVPTVSASEPTDIYVYYRGKGAVVDAANALVGYSAVWEMRQISTGSNVLDLLNTATATKVTDTEPSPILGGGQTFDRVNDYVNAGSTINTAALTELTVESIINWTGGGVDENQIISNWSSTAGSFMLRLEPVGSVYGLEGFVLCQTDTQKGGTFASPVSPNVTHFVGMVFNTTELAGFIDTVKCATTFATGAALDSTAPGNMYIGLSPHSPVELYGGSMYTIMLSNVARSDAWMKARAINLLTPGTLMAYGNEESFAATAAALMMGM